MACRVFDERCRDTYGSAFGASSGREMCRGVYRSLAATHRATETTVNDDVVVVPKIHVSTNSSRVSSLAADACCTKRNRHAVVAPLPFPVEDRDTEESTRDTGVNQCRQTFRFSHTFATSVSQMATTQPVHHTGVAPTTCTLFVDKTLYTAPHTCRLLYLFLSLEETLCHSPD